MDDPIPALYSDVHSYQELLHVNADFLRGKHAFTCYSVAPVQEETQPLVPTLLRLHSYGLYTMISQPGTKMPQDPQNQRSYIEFLCPETTAKLIFEDLYNDSRVYTCRQLPRGGGVDENFPGRKLNLTQLENGDESNNWWRDSLGGDIFYIVPGVERVDDIIRGLAVYSVVAREYGPETDCTTIVLHVAEKHIEQLEKYEV
ncbi:hypothetical protein Ndes2526B_g03796 [Nannochloris sp. 'desiccata']